MGDTLGEAVSELSRLDSFVERLAKLDASGAAEVLEEPVPPASVVALAGEFLAPAEVELHRLYQMAQIGAVELEAATAICRRFLARAATSPMPGSHPKLAVVCPEGESRTFPAELLAATLQAHGWPVDLVARGVSVSDLRAYLSEDLPWALVLSCATAGALPGAARAIDSAHELEVPVVATGDAFGRDDLRASRLGAGAWAANASVAQTILSQWEADRPQLPVGRSVSEEYAAFESGLPRLSLTVGDALRAGDGRRLEDAGDLLSVRRKVEPLLEHLAAAILVDDSRVLLDFLSSQLAFTRARSGKGEYLVAALDAVNASVAGLSGQAARFLNDGRQHLHWSINRGAGAPPVKLHQIPAKRAMTPISPPEGNVRPMGGTDMNQGQVFADLLFLAAMATHAPMALISVAQPDGAWSTLSFGVDKREALNDPALFAAIADRSEPLELFDLTASEEFASSPLATGPLAVRFAIGIPLLTRAGSSSGVFVVLDRRARQLTRHERQATLAVARQVTGQLVLWRRSASPRGEERVHPAERRQVPGRQGPDAALANLLGVRGSGLSTEQHLLRSHEVAVLFDVTERTVINWAASSKLPSIRTAGGHLRFRSEDVMALLAGRSNPGRPD